MYIYTGTCACTCRWLQYPSSSSWFSCDFSRGGHQTFRTLCVCVQVFVCHDSDTGMEMAVKVIDINHIDLRPHNLEAKRMQTVSIPCPCASCTCTCSLFICYTVYMYMYTQCLGSEISQYMYMCSVIMSYWSMWKTFFHVHYICVCTWVLKINAELFKWSNKWPGLYDLLMLFANFVILFSCFATARARCSSDDMFLSLCGL